MSDEQAPPGQRVLHAPEGCGFSELPVLPVQVSLMCQPCGVAMYCKATVPSLMVHASAGPPQPDFLHECPACHRTVRMKQPWPTIRYVPHPEFEPVSEDEYHRLQAEMSQRTEQQLTEVPTSSPSEGE